MTNITELNYTPCPQIDPSQVAAAFDLYLDELTPNYLKLDTSWGCYGVDLTPALKFNETVTHLLLTANALQYNREDYGVEGAPNKGVDCISGDDLSRIISMRYLKDVSQATTPANGDVYMYSNVTNLFEPYDLQTFINETNTTLEQHQQAITQLQNKVTSLSQQFTQLSEYVTSQLETINNRLAVIEQTIAKPNGIPSDAVIAWGNRNIYGDYTNTNLRTAGIFTHSTTTTLANDQYFA